MVDYNRLELALDLLAEQIETEATALRLIKMVNPPEYVDHINSVKDKLSQVVMRLEALKLDLDLV